MKIAVTDTGRADKQKVYLNWLQSFEPGAELVVVSHRDAFSGLSDCDGLVLTGGVDVDPSLSKASPVELVEEFDRARDDFEFRLLENALNERIPIFGICRGLQVANVFLGGTLVADLPAAGFQSHTAGTQGQELRHSITVIDGSQMKSIAAVSKGEINSYHHQSVLSAAGDLLPSGHSDDHVIESLEWKEKQGKSFLLLVQWHPERMTDTSNPFVANIGSAFFAEAKKFNSMK